MKDIASYDIVLGTPGTSIGGAEFEFLRFHRVVLDEAHSFRSTTHKAFTNARFMWCVTATPFGSSIYDISSQCSAMRIEGVLPNSYNKGRITIAIVPLLQRFMIRHTKVGLTHQPNPHINNR